MLTYPVVIALDVNQTLSDMSPLAARLEEVGAPGHLLETWFASTLRDGFALAAAGGYADFEAVAQAALRSILSATSGVAREPREAAEFVLAGMGELSLHPDVAPGLERLHAAGMRLVALSNGRRSSVEQLLQRGGVLGLVEECLSVEEVRRWKPAPEPYRYAVERCGVAPEQMMLVAAHPWDTDGAKRAGLAAGWINRSGAPYPDPLRPPDLSCKDFGELADALAR